MFTPTRHRIAYLDGLRAIAVLLVVIHHAIADSKTRGTLARVLSHGNHGVELFFILSGFCLSYPTLSRLRRDTATSFDVVRYAAHRVVRIVPPYWLAIVATVGFGFIVTRLGFTLPQSFSNASPLDVIQQALFVDPGVRLVSAPFWTLPLEFRWYLLFPITLWLWTKSPRAFAAFGIAMFAATLTRVVNFDLLYLPPFLLGIVAADVHVRKLRFGLWSIAACVVILAYAVLTPITWRSYYDHSPIWYLGAFAFVIAAGEWEWLNRLLSLRLLTVVGLASYSIYLVHDPVVTFACEHGAHVFMAALLGVGAGFAFWSLAERPFVYTSLRQKATTEFDTVFSTWLPQLGIGRRMALRSENTPIQRAVAS